VDIYRSCKLAVGLRIDESSERGFLLFMVLGTSHSEIRPGSRAFRVVSSYASALPEQLCACRLAPPCTRRERVTPSKRRGPRRLCLQEHSAATPRAYRGGKETAKAVGVFADARRHVHSGDADENATQCPRYASRACERLRRGGTLQRLACRLFRFGKGCPLCPG